MKKADTSSESKKATIELDLTTKLPQAMKAEEILEMLD